LEIRRFVEIVEDTRAIEFNRGREGGSEELKRKGAGGGNGEEEIASFESASGVDVTDGEIDGRTAAEGDGRGVSPFDGVAPEPAGITEGNGVVGRVEIDGDGSGVSPFDELTWLIVARSVGLEAEIITEGC